MCLCCFSFLRGKESRVMKQWTRSLWRENVSLGWIFRGAQVGNCPMRDTTPKLTAAGGNQVNNKCYKRVSQCDALWTVENEQFTSAESDSQTNTPQPPSERLHQRRNWLQSLSRYSDSYGEKKHHSEVKMFLPGQDVFKKTPKVRHTLWAALGDAGKEQEETSNRTWEGAALCHRSLGDIFSTHFQKTPKPCLKWVFPHQLCEVHVELRTVTQGHEAFPLPPNFMLIKSSGSRCLWLRSPHLSKQPVPQLHQLGFSWQNNREKRGLLTLTHGR